MAKLSKRALMLQEEAEADEWLWESIRGKDLNDVDWYTCIQLGRRRTKQELYEWAQEVAGRFWDVHNQHRRGEGCPVEYGAYRVRVKEKSWTIYIEWYRQEIKGNKERNFQQATPLPSPKNAGGKMSMQHFTKAKDWEIEAIKEAEEEFAQIRKICEHLEKIRFAVSGIHQIMVNRNAKRAED